MADGLHLLNVGMVTPVGLDAPQSAASIWAGICKHAETSIHDKRFEPFTMSLLPDDVLPPLHPDVAAVIGLTSRQMRMLRLGTMALQEAAVNLQPAETVPLFLGMPAPLPERDSPAGEHFIEHLCTCADISLDIKNSAVFPNGRAAGLYALKAAEAFISSGKGETAVVGAIDTFLDLHLLATLDSEERILGERVMDGFVPGEAAAFLVVSKNANGTTVLADLSSVATGFEEGHLYSEEPYRGDGLANVFSEAFSISAFNKSVTDVFSPMNGENHWAKEWGVAFIRNTPRFTEEHAIHHPADCIGDTGAACGLILATLAALWKNSGKCTGPSLAYGSSDYGERAAVLIQ